MHISCAFLSVLTFNIGLLDVEVTYLYKILPCTSSTSSLRNVCTLLDEILKIILQFSSCHKILGLCGILVQQEPILDLCCQQACNYCMQPTTLDFEKKVFSFEMVKEAISLGGYKQSSSICFGDSDAVR